MEKIDLEKQVINKHGDISTVVSITLNEKNDKYDIPYENFIKTYENYLDPRDVEIKRLRALVDKLRKGTKKRKTRKVLSPGEWKEIDELIIIGKASNIDIAKEYEVSDSGISKRRRQIEKMK